MNTPRSLILITVDCLRADHTGFSGYAQPTTPFLDGLAKECSIFRNAIVAGSPTYYSFPATMASRYPLALGRDVLGLAPGEPTLASALQGSGYATAAFVAGNPYLSNRSGYHQGFEFFNDFLNGETSDLQELENPATRRNGLRGRINRTMGELSHKLGPLARIYDDMYFRYGQRVAAEKPLSWDQLRRFPAADVIVDRAREWLLTLAGRPFFSLHFMDPHAPYYPSQPALDLMGSKNIDAARARYLNSFWNRDLSPRRLQRSREEIVTLYDAGIRWVDSQVGRLVDELRRLAVWNDCVLALTGDHGEEFLDHGGRFHSPSKMTEELIRVPLLLRAPRMGMLGPVASPFSLVDLAPTLLDAVDAKVPDRFQGLSRREALQNAQSWEDAAIVESIFECTNPFRPESRMGPRILCVREGRYKLVLNFGPRVETLFDLESDPQEQRPLRRDEAKPVWRRLFERARQHLADSVQSRDQEVRMAAHVQDLRLRMGPVTGGDRAETVRGTPNSLAG